MGRLHEIGLAFVYFEHAFLAFQEIRGHSILNHVVVGHPVQLIDVQFPFRRPFGHFQALFDELELAFGEFCKSFISDLFHGLLDIEFGRGSASLLNLSYAVPDLIDNPFRGAVGVNADFFQNFVGRRQGAGVGLQEQADEGDLLADTLDHLVAFVLAVLGDEIFAVL